MNTQTTQPSHDWFKPMATGRQLERKRLHRQCIARRALERSYDEAVMAMVRAARVPDGYRQVTWTVNDGFVYIGIEKLPVPRDQRDDWRRRGEAPSQSRRRTVEAPTGGFTWVEAGPLPDPRAVARRSGNSSANDGFIRHLERLAA